jgi:ADP-heptose:LPS heptosyltransferase
MSNKALSPTILAIRLRQLGDVVTTLGSLRALKRASPGHRIAFVADRSYHELLGRAEFVDQLVSEPPKVHGLSGAAAYGDYIESLRRLGPTCVIDFHSNTRSAILSVLTGARVRAGFDVRVRKIAYTDVEPRSLFRDGQPVPRNSHESALALVRRAGFDGVSGDATRTLTTTDGDRVEGRRLLEGAGVPGPAIDEGVLVGLNPGSPYPSKAWPATEFGRLAAVLRGDGMTTVVFWGPGELGNAQRVVESSGGAAVLAPSLPLGRLPGVLARCRLVVTIDSGLKHLAVAIGVPTVTLFGPTSPYEWHVAGDTDRYVYPAAPCSPCRLRECPLETPCMSRITAEEVRGHVLQMRREA